MIKNISILDLIAKDLKIKRYNEEKIENYRARVIYSAIGIWIRTVTLDEDAFYDNYSKPGVSKIHIKNRVTPFLENMLEIYPEVLKWFEYTNEKGVIEIVRDRLYKAGELVDVGYETDLSLPIYEECKLNDEYKIIRGMSIDRFNKIIGLGQIDINDKNENDIFEFLGLFNKNSEDILEEYLNNAIWNESQGKDYEYFNKYSKKTLSKCWEKEYCLKNGDITLYRIFSKEYSNEYGFVKRENNKLYFSYITDYLISEHEIRRFMYALKKESDTSILAYFKHYDESELTWVKLYNMLPAKEYNILMLIGWPKYSIEDDFNFIIDRSCWNFVEKMLSNLGIILKENSYGE